VVSAAGGRHRAIAPVPSAEATDDPSAVLSETVTLLVDAIVSLSADLDLDAVLRRTVEAACLLTEAPHGMLAVFDDERAILYGERPLGQPLSLANRGLHFDLGPRERPFARLYLAQRFGQPFNARDELLLAQLAVAAEQAIANAIAYQRVAAERGADVGAHTGPDVGADVGADLARDLGLDTGSGDPDSPWGDLDEGGVDHAGAEIESAVRVERERIARDLHDTVIQRLFATGLQLQALRRTVDEESGAAITLAVRDLDATMKDLRATVYGLRRSRPASVLAQVEALVDEYAAGLGFRPTLHHTGPVDAQLDGDLGDHVLATLREALSNIVKHARATAAAVELHVSPAWTLLRVTDNGVGIPEGERGVLGSGLSNLRTRAERLGGVLHVGGNGVDWIVPTPR
jgi:signal transduction histidine kinase